VFLLVTPLLPALVGVRVETGPLAWAERTAGAVVLAGLVAWLAGTRGRAAAERIEAAWERASLGRVTVASGAVLTAALVLVSVVAFGRRPLHVDSIAHLFQAEIFLHGMARAPRPPDPAFFATLNMIFDTGGWYAQYPPGHAALLAPGVLVGAAWLVPIALSLATFVTLIAFTRRAYGPDVARGTAVLLALCPFLWFMGAGYMNHVSALFAVSLLLYGVSRWEGEGRVRWLGMAGAAAGLGFVSRPLTTVAFAAPLAVFVFARSVRSGRRVAPVAGLAGFAPFALAYLAFNRATTGHAFLSGYTKLWGEGHGLGFHVSPWGEVHTPAIGIVRAIGDLASLSDVLFEWPIPALLPAGIALATGWTDRRDWDRWLLAAFLALPLAYLFYWHHGVFRGPRFLYAGLAAIVPLTAASLGRVWSALGERSLPFGARRGASARFAMVVLLIVGVANAVFLEAPERFRRYAGELTAWKVDLAGEARSAGIERGVVFVPVSWGNRILAELHGAGVPASLAELAYRRVDHCRLEMAIRESIRDGTAGMPLTATVAGLVERGERVVAVDANGDPTLRLAPGRPLTPECLAELRHDAGGFTSYAPHLLENDALLAGPLVVARDLRERNGELRDLYAARRAWIYRNGEFHPVPDWR